MLRESQTRECKALHSDRPVSRFGKLLHGPCKLCVTRKRSNSIANAQGNSLCPTPIPRQCVPICENQSRKKSVKPHQLPFTLASRSSWQCEMRKSLKRNATNRIGKNKEYSQKQES